MTGMRNTYRQFDPHRIHRWGVPSLLSLVTFGVYPATLAPGLTWSHEGADGGDLITAAYTLGIPHPTGYPLYTLLGRLFSLLPVGNVAYRLHLMSATCAALTAFVFYAWVRGWLRRALPSLPELPCTVASTAASLLLAFSRLLWSQALIAEVYALNALAVTSVLYLLWRWESAPEGSDTSALALCALSALSGLPRK